MLFEVVLSRLVDIVQAAVDLDVCRVDISPYGMPPPGTIKPFIGIHCVNSAPVYYEQSLKYMTTASMIGTIRVRPKPIQKYKEPYLGLLNLMEKANLAVHAGRNTLMVALIQAIADFNTGHDVSGYFFVQSFDMIPRSVGPEWFSSEDQAHSMSERDVGYTLTTTIKFPNLLLNTGC